MSESRPTRSGPPRPDPTPNLRFVLARVRIHARRWHLARWAIALSAAALLAASVQSARSDAADAQREWSDTRFVWVALGRLESGHEIDSSDVERRELPVGAIPVDPTDDPIGIRLIDSVVAGEVIRSGRLATRGAGEIAARLPPGTRGVTVPVDAGSVLSIGDSADLIALRNGRALAPDVRVVSTDDGWATFAVDNTRISAVVNELTLGGVIAVLHP